MSTSCSLFRIQNAPTVTSTEDGQPVVSPDDRYRIVGTLADTSVVIHGQRGAPIPKTALFTYYDGSQDWTWDDFAKAQPQIAGACVPHEWYGSFTTAYGTAKAFTYVQYPKAQPTADVTSTKSTTTTTTK